MTLHWLALLVSFVVTAFGQVTYKYFARSKNIWHFALSISFFVIAPFTSYIALQQIGIGMVFIGAAFSQILILFLSQYFLRERLTKDHMISMGLIVMGLLIYALGSQG